MDFHRDWGLKTMLRQMHMIINHKKPDDFILTGVTHSVKYFTDICIF